MLQNYEPVDSRIKALYELFPEARITTELLSYTPNFETVVFKAFIWVEHTLIATGHAIETISTNPKTANFDSHLENCETSAIGRALANYGISGKFRPSKEEMSKLMRRPGGAQKNSTKAPLTPKNSNSQKDQVTKQTKTSNKDLPNLANPKLLELGEYIVPLGRRIKGKKIRTIGLDTLTEAVTFLTDRSVKTNQPLTPQELEFVNIATEYLELKGYKVDIFNESILEELAAPLAPPLLAKEAKLAEAPPTDTLLPSKQSPKGEAEDLNKKTTLIEQQELLKLAQTKNIGLEDIKGFLKSQNFDPNLTKLNKNSFKTTKAWLESL